jgi:hypothetical protein
MYLFGQIIFMVYVHMRLLCKDCSREIKNKENFPLGVLKKKQQKMVTSKDCDIYI